MTSATADPLSLTFSALADPTRHPRSARGGRGDRRPARTATRDEPAVDLAPPEGARAGRPRGQGKVGAVAPVPARPRTTRRGGLLDGPVPRVLRVACRTPHRATCTGTRTGGFMTSADPTPRSFTLTW